MLPQAYAAASGDVGLANARQIYYAARPEILRSTGKDSLDSQYFCQMREHRVECSGWDVVWDDRGHFKEPHRGKTFGLGTLNVRRHLRDNASPVWMDAGFRNATILTHGPEGRFGAVLFIEK